MKYLLYFSLTISAFCQTTLSDFYRFDLSAKTSHHWVFDTTYVAANGGRLVDDLEGAAELIEDGSFDYKLSDVGSNPLYVGGRGLRFATNDNFHQTLTDTLYGIKIVFQPTTTITSVSSPQMLIHTEGGFYGLAIGASSATVTNEVISLTDAASNRYDWKSATDSVTSERPHILIVMWNAATTKYRFFLDGIEKTVDKIGSAGVIVMDTNFNIGKRQDNNWFYNGDIFEVKLYDKQLTDAEVIAESFLPSGWHCNNTGAVRQDSSSTWAFNIGAVGDTLYYNPGVSGTYTVTLDALAEASSSLKLYSGSSSATNAVGTVSATNTYSVKIGGNLFFANASADSVWWDNVLLTRQRASNSGSFKGWLGY